MKEITFEDIKKANESIVTLYVKGKDYAQVNERIKAFRMVYPTGTIETEMLSNENGIVIFKAHVIGNGITLGTGTAYEKENSTFINKTSYIENCETSAVGRALGMAGFGIDTSIVSAEEVQNAIKQQEDNTLTLDKVKLKETLERMIIENDIDRDGITKKYGVNDLLDLSEEQLNDAIKVITDWKKKKGDKK